MLVRDIIIYFSLKYKGNFTSIYEAINRLEPADEKEYEVLKSKVKCGMVTILDNEYPEILKTINKPPFVLYYYGDISLLKHRNILGIVGSRNINSYASSAVTKIINEMENKDFVIVSGLAKGVDSLAHKLALNNSISTIAVLGTGIEYCYPIENFDLYDNIKENGLVISEYPFRENVPQNAFPFRNRIITALSNWVFIPDAHKNSGSMISLRYALEQGKDIFTIPYSIFEDNIANTLIQEGAKLICKGEDIEEEFR